MDIIWHPALRALIPHNPIIVYLLRQQQRSTSSVRGFLETVGIVSIALCFAIAMLFSVVNTLDPWRWGEYRAYIQILAWIFHAAAALRFIAAGVQFEVWNSSLLDSENLMLTPISNWQLLLGKWWIAMHRIRGWILALAIVQLGIVISGAFGARMIFDWGMECLNPCVFTIGKLSLRWFLPSQLLIIVMSAIGIAILESACCTLLGMVATMLMRSRFGFIAAIFLRFTPVFIFTFWPDYAWSFGNFMQRYIEYTWFSFADAGTSALLRMAHPVASPGGFQRGVLALYAVLGMYLAYLSVSFLTAWVLMRRSRPE